MIVDYPAPAQAPMLRALWKEAFADTDDFLNTFFHTGFHPRRCRCITEDGAVAAALYWFEATCRGQRFAYVYAVATAKSRRGQGLFSALLADTKRLLTDIGFDGILLVPETEALGRMYEKFGFFPCTSIWEQTVEAGAQKLPVRQISVDAYALLRRQMLPEDAVVQEGEILPLLAAQYHFWAGEGFLALGQFDDGKLICREFLGDERAMPGLLRTLEVRCGHFRTPGTQRPFAWLLPLQPHCMRPAYFGLALD